jgi:amyloid beta A4 protein
MMHTLLLQALSGTVDLPAAHFEPQVAMYCGPDKQQVYHSQYMTESGHWVTDLNNKAKCLKDKVEILDYCKKVSTVIVARATSLCHPKPRRKVCQ